MDEQQLPPRVTSLDRKIAAAGRRAEQERKQQVEHRAPTQGLTSQLSTPNCNVPNLRKTGT